MIIGVISLGCDKNRIDTENMLAYLKEYGYTLTNEVENSDIIIVNTCGFIDSAKEESIETILEMAEYKKKGKCKYLIVTGCLSQRYMDELYDELKEVDLFIGTTKYHELPSLIKQLVDTNERKFFKNDINDRYFSTKRVLTTPQHYAYLKIAEGCSNHCTYCAIPNIRGKYTSRDDREIIQEAKDLVSNFGVKEIILVAQDVSKYGQENKNICKLIDLLDELSKIDVEWIRLLYLYPENISDELLDYMASNKKICKYLDIPLQHYSSSVLKRMNRHIDSSYIDNLFEKIESYKCFTIRSTFIVGFPGETKEEYESLKQFIKKGKIDRCGFFTYSKEEGTAAARMKDQIDEKIKIKRQKELYSIQQDVMVSRMQEKINSVVDVIYEGIDYDRQMFYGRTSFDAPEIDTKVYFTSEILVDVGNIYKVKLIKMSGLDYEGKIV